MHTWLVPGIGSFKEHGRGRVQQLDRGHTAIVILFKCMQCLCKPNGSSSTASSSSAAATTLYGITTYVWQSIQYTYHVCLWLVPPRVPAVPMFWSTSLTPPATKRLTACIALSKMCLYLDDSYNAIENKVKFRHNSYMNTGAWCMCSNNKYNLAIWTSGAAS